MATETQTKLVGFCLGNKANYSATAYANHIWFDPTNKQILLNGIEYIPKKLSELVNDKNFITSITKAMVEGVLTGNITSHTHTFASITSKPTTLSGYGITDGLRRVTLANNVENDFNTFENLTLTGRGDPTTGSSILNSPWTTQPAGGFGVLTYLWSGYGLQLAAGYLSNDLYIRSKYYFNGGANWSTRWDKILNSSNYDSYAPTKTGGGASGTWGISITGNAATATNADTLDGYHASSFGRTNLIDLPHGKVLRISMGDIRGYLINIQGTNRGRNALYFITGYGDGTVIRNNIRVIKGGTYNIYFNGTSETGCAYIVNNGEFTGADKIYINPFGYDDVAYTIVSSVPSDAVLVSSSDSNILATLSSNVATATALTSSAGSATQPIYFSNGKPVACSYTLAKSVPSNAVFTDTTYSVATASADGLMSAAMFKAQMVKSVGIRRGGIHVIEGGSITDHSVYITQNKNNITGVYQTAVGENDVQIPNATKDYDGSMSYTDKIKLDNVHNNCVAASVYVLNLSYNFTDLNGLTLKMTNFLGLSAAIASGNRPDMIRLVTNSTTHIFTLYDSTNVINDGSFFYYRCDGKNAEISIENDEISFSIN